MSPELHLDGVSSIRLGRDPAMDAWLDHFLTENNLSYLLNPTLVVQRGGHVGAAYLVVMRNLRVERRKRRLGKAGGFATALGAVGGAGDRPQPGVDRG